MFCRLCRATVWHKYTSWPPCSSGNFPFSPSPTIFWCTLSPSPFLVFSFCLSLCSLLSLGVSPYKKRHFSANAAAVALLAAVATQVTAAPLGDQQQLQPRFQVIKIGGGFRSVTARPVLQRDGDLRTTFKDIKPLSLRGRDVAGGGEEPALRARRTKSAHELKYGKRVKQSDFRVSRRVSAGGVSADEEQPEI
ncbi:hypothetical protein GGTG_14399 [Gaeumannomyces tritici R3-111a-1]|uniref:Uncharacterized protein n=1 Tax=Gaeumannomyces tritici (strain R3-111a-1) TaxID=644352 RepID=J3PLD4_GAET3|nr:hypothetical protein GGTG_14399 [Gaeumannomyces tritici R3-111a-1]EJT68023.1 hypothetical protein GGTG_14399 [Gaeumannomyces tritici R3-111a-1]